MELAASNSETEELVNALNAAFERERKSMSVERLSSTINAIQHLLANICTYRNTYTPINRLPAELLIHIFRQNLFEYERGDTRLMKAQERNTVLRPLLTLTHVCKHWRQVALAHPILWTRLDLGNEDLLQAFVERSQSAPLSIFLDATSVKDPSPLVGRFASRLRRLDLLVGYDWMHEIPPRLLSFQAPILDCLTITVSLSPRFLPLRSTTKYLTLDSLISLRALALTPIPFWIPSNIFPNLTHLYLSFYGAADVESLFRFLSSTPNLESLRITDLWKQPETVSSNVPVTLGRLQSLVFDFSRLDSCLAVAKILRLSSQTVLQVHNTIFVNEDLHEFPTVEQLSGIRLLTSITRLHVLSKSVRNDTSDVGDDDTDDVGDDTYDYKAQVVAEGMDSGLWLHGNCTIPSAHLTMQWMNDLSTVLPLENITVLCLDICIWANGTWSVEDWLQRTPHLETLKVAIRPYWADWTSEQGNEPMSLLEFMCASLRALSKDSPSLCPRLSTLFLYVDFDPNQDEEWNAYLDALVDMVIARSSMGHPIRFLSIIPMMPLPFDGDDEDEEPERKGVYDRFYERLAGLRDEKYLEELELSNDPNWFSVEVGERWDVKGTDKYWEFDGRDRIVCRSVRDPDF